MKGEAQVFAKPGKSFDPAEIPKAIKDAGFSATEVLVEASGTLAKREGSLQIDVSGLNYALTLSGGPQRDALATRADLVGKKVQVTGKLETNHGDLPPRLTVENFQLAP